MQKVLASIVCFSLCAVMATAQGGNGKGKLKIEGTWTATGGSYGGKKVSDEILAKTMIVITFKDGKYTASSMGKEEESGTYTIDAKKKPSQIDFTIAEGKDKGKSQLGLVKVDGDVMTVASAKAGSKDRPKDFEGGTGISVTVLKRGK